MNDVLKYLLTIALFLILVPAFSQQDTTAMPGQETIIGAVRKKLNQLRGAKDADSLKIKSLPADSLAGKGKDVIDSVEAGVNKSIQNVSDRVNTDRLDSLQNLEAGEKIIQKIDSVGNVPDQQLSKVEDKVNRPQQFINQKSDSITSLLNKPADAVNKKIDDAVNKANSRIDSLQRKAMYSVDETENKIQDKVSKITDGEIDVPGIDKSKIQDVEIGGVSIGEGSSVEGIELGENIDVEVPGLNTESLDIEVPEIEDIKVGDYSIPDAGELKELSEVKEVENIKQQVSGELDNADVQLAELEKYESDLRKVKDGDMKELDTRAETELMKIDEVSGVIAEARKAAEVQAQQQAMMQKYADKKLLQEEIKRKLQQVATEKVNHLSPVFQESQGKITAAKKKYDEVISLEKDLPKRKRNSLAGKSFYQRLLPGSMLQVYNADQVMVDASLQIGYRFSERFTAGLGGVYRIGISDEYEYYVQTLHVFGGRVYGDWMFKKGFFVHGEFEALRVGTDIQAKQPLQTEELPDHAYNAYGGIGKQFNISRRWRGQVIGLYRFELNGFMPDVSKFNVRLGFLYDLGKKKKELY